MTRSNIVDSLPPGWTMMERVRGNGKRDKFYSAPNNGPTFKSMVQAQRYLSSHKPKNKYRNAKKPDLRQSWKLIGVEEARSENLPRGWIGEIRVRECSETIRRDPCYTDPVTKTKFRSLKAVYRHLKSCEDSDHQSIQSGSGKSVANRTRSQTPLGQISAMSGSELVNGQPQIRRRSKRLAGLEVDTVELKPTTRPRRHGDVIFDKTEVTENETTGLAFRELLSDPCIAFAINVLAGPTTVDDLFKKAKSDGRSDKKTEN